MQSQINSINDYERLMEEQNNTLEEMNQKLDHHELKYQSLCDKYDRQSETCLKLQSQVDQLNFRSNEQGLLIAQQEEEISSLSKVVEQ